MKYRIVSEFGGADRQEGQGTNSLAIAKYLQGRAIAYYESRGYKPSGTQGVVSLHDKAGLKAGTVRIIEKEASK